VSALAQYYLSKGHEVSGSDLVRSEITDFLKRPKNGHPGIKVFIGKHKMGNISRDVDLVVYSPAVRKDNPELKQAKKCKIKTISYPEALGELTKEYYTIAVAGAHGKTTTTAMLGLVLERAGLDPTVIVGTKVKEFEGSNFRAGKSKLLVIEACEYDSSFLYYSPKIIVVTNIDKEHLDYFHNLKNVIKAFKKFINKLPKGGFLAVNEDDKNIFQIINPKSQFPISNQIKNSKFQILKYGLSQPEAKKISKIMKVPGEHNVSNALAVLQVARILEIPDEITFNALSEFSGTWRRFEIRNAELRGSRLAKQAGRGTTRKIIIISDYAHHPNEISATLKAAREKYPKRRVLCVFQPHQHQRTHYLFDDFVKIFRQAQDDHFVDKIIVTDIYDVAGRETKKISSGISSKKLVQKIARGNVVYCATDRLEKHIKENLKPNDVLVIMGAGDIYKLVGKF